MQFGKSQARDWVMDMVSHINNPYLRGQLKPPSHTIQGFIIASADGQSYDWLNDSDPREVKTFIEKGLKWYHDTNHPQQSISESAISEPFSKQTPEDASTIRVFSRIRPLPPGADELNNSVGRDHMWIFADELKEIVDKSTNDGGAIDLPNSVVMRLLRFHLIDNVRGEPDMWRSSQIKISNFAAILVKRSAMKNSYRFAGKFSESASDNSKGISGEIEGQFDVDCNTFHLSKWRAFSQSQAWGRSTFTPGEPRGKFPLVISMIETSDDISKIVPPQAVSHGENYRNP